MSARIGYLASRSKRERVELSGPRGLDFPPSDLMSVHAIRQVLEVTLPEAEPASKRRRV